MKFVDLSGVYVAISHIVAITTNPDKDGSIVYMVSGDELIVDEHKDEILEKVKTNG